MLARDKPKEVRLWQATNPEARDFRVETFGRKYTSTVVSPDQHGLYRSNVTKPEKGWTAYFLELTFDVGAPVQLKLTTNVVVIPDVIPFEGKPSHLPTSLTLICTALSEEAAKKVVEAATVFAREQKISECELKSVVSRQAMFYQHGANGRFSSRRKNSDGISG